MSDVSNLLLISMNGEKELEKEGQTSDFVVRSFFHSMVAQFTRILQESVVVKMRAVNCLSFLFLCAWLSADFVFFDRVCHHLTPNSTVNYLTAF